MFLRMDANAGTDPSMEGCGDDKRIALGAYGRDAHDDNGKWRLWFATNCKLAVTNILFKTRDGGT